MKTTLSKIRSLRNESESAWTLACETAGIAEGGERHDQERQDAAEHDAEMAMDLWDEAIEAIKAGDTEAAIEALSKSADFANNWGDDSLEIKAIAEIKS